MAAALGESDSVVAAQFLAGTDAPSTDDTQVIVAVIEGIGHFQRNVAVLVTQGRFQVHTQVAHCVFQLAALVLGTGYTAVVDRNVAQANIVGPANVYAVASEATVGMLGDEHFHNGTAELVNFVHLVAHHHAVGYRQGAGGREAALPLNFHHTHSASGIGLHSRVVAQVGEVDSGINGRFQHHLAGLSVNLYPVNCDGDVVGHFRSLPSCDWEKLPPRSAGREPRFVARASRASVFQNVRFEFGWEVPKGR